VAVAAVVVDIELVAVGLLAVAEDVDCVVVAEIVVAVDGRVQHQSYQIDLLVVTLHQ
jgi:hypothetical protein